MFADEMVMPTIATHSLMCSSLAIHPTGVKEPVSVWESEVMGRKWQ